jgi:hypothetical protein
MNMATASVSVTKGQQVTFFRLARELDGNAVISVNSVVNWFQRHDIAANLDEGRCVLLVPLDNGETAAYQCQTAENLQKQFYGLKQLSKAVMVKPEEAVIDTTEFNYWLYQIAFGEEYDREADLKPHEQHRRLCAAFSQMLSR